MFWCKIFPVKYDVVIALCDEELLDKELEMKDFKIKVSKHFYGGRLIDESMAFRLLRKATIGNLIGKNVVEFAEKNGFIARENIIFIDEVPHAQFVKI